MKMIRNIVMIIIVAVVAVGCWSGREQSGADNPVATSTVATSTVVVDKNTVATPKPEVYRNEYVGIEFEYPIGLQGSHVEYQISEKTTTTPTIVAEADKFLPDQESIDRFIRYGCATESWTAGFRCDQAKVVKEQLLDGQLYTINAQLMRVNPKESKLLGGVDFFLYYNSKKFSTVSLFNIDRGQVLEIINSIKWVDSGERPYQFTMKSGLWEVASVDCHCSFRMPKGWNFEYDQNKDMNATRIGAVNLLTGSGMYILPHGEYDMGLPWVTSTVSEAVVSGKKFSKETWLSAPTQGFSFYKPLEEIVGWNKWGRIEVLFGGHQDVVIGVLNSIKFTD